MGERADRMTGDAIVPRGAKLVSEKQALDRSWLEVRRLARRTRLTSHYFAFDCSPLTTRHRAVAAARSDGRHDWCRPGPASRDVVTTRVATARACCAWHPPNLGAAARGSIEVHFCLPFAPQNRGCCCRSCVAFFGCHGPWFVGRLRVRLDSGRKSVEPPAPIPIRI